MSDISAFSACARACASSAAPKYASQRTAREVVVELALLRGVRELEGRVVVAAVLVVEQPEPRAVVDVVLGQEVVVARNRGQRAAPHRALDVRDCRHALPESVRDPDPALVGEREIALGDSEHVEVEQEARPGVESPDRIGHPAGHRRRAKRFPGHRLPRNELEHHHLEVGQVLDDARPDAGLGGRQRVRVLVRPIDRE